MFLLETEPRRTVDFCHFPKVGRGLSKELTRWQTLKVFLLERQREKRAGIFCVESWTHVSKILIQQYVRPVCWTCHWILMVLPVTVWKLAQ